MSIDALRRFCLSLPDATEDVKWGQDLAFCIGGKMIPAPYLARAMWVQEEQLGEALDRRELEALIRTSYELVKAKLPKQNRKSGKRPKRKRAAAAASRRTRR